MDAGRREAAARTLIPVPAGRGGNEGPYIYNIACACARFRACKQYYCFDTEDGKDGVPGEVFRQKEGVALRAIR